MQINNRDKTPLREVNLSVRGTNFTQTLGVGIYSRLNNAHRLEINIGGSINATSGVTLYVEGVNFSDAAQAFAAITSSANAPRAKTTVNTNEISLLCAASFTTLQISGNVELSGPPAWA